MLYPSPLSQIFLNTHFFQIRCILSQSETNPKKVQSNMTQMHPAISSLNNFMVLTLYSAWVLLLPHLYPSEPLLYCSDLVSPVRQQICKPSPEVCWVLCSALWTLPEVLEFLSVCQCIVALLPKNIRDATQNLRLEKCGQRKKGREGKRERRRSSEG